MQRHFSHRGEALAEVTAARMLARRNVAQSGSAAAGAGQRLRPGQWFSQPVGTTSQRTKKQRDRNGEVTTSL
jgi:hypothetical protein